ncbi:isopropylmalate isomerase large subunit [Parvularcula bermudensis HTCC2503]|uniref:3-isopropylmalate dehydratase large subunit n=1 Tax=Parvularcula bermudensis (strain ATCC BAA-594 / HTCC2503 / KCTC 12087) TaxID=314260 RepID=E0THN0_PARBH|nr:3-isopropylmalate dehydratase large subunit [Parvularcula bermudensis]ADM09326.1 isopropylmalate isomerase large subunit [Parvularcula bermudensis HTCC2503]
MTAKTLFQKVWERNLVRPETVDSPAILHVGLHLVHEVTSPQAFTVLDQRDLKVRRPDRTLATIDHSVPTLPADAEGRLPYATAAAEKQVAALRRNCARHGITLLDLGDDRRGIVHMVGPELGRTHPGAVVVCGDSHTSTHGAFGALAFGIGTTEVGHVLATQCLLQRKPRTLRVMFEGTCAEGVTAKDMALTVIAHLGMDGGTGHVIEYAGEAVRALSMEGRMTLCNLSIEAGARAGMVAPDETTFAYLTGRPGAPTDWEGAVTAWRDLHTDDGAEFDKEIVVDAAAIRPMVTYGVSPHEALPATGDVPAPANDAARTALDYMGFQPGDPLAARKVDRVFVGSCTNGRLEDLRAAANILKGRRIADHVTMLVVPGSEAVKRAAEAEGLDQVFMTAGAEWREPGCSMCIAMNGDRGNPGEIVVSTSNRNFRGRQGEGVRTVLASPATAAASAVKGMIADASMLEGRAA